jgi:type II secretory pathway predicted ATPase ExeA
MNSAAENRLSYFVDRDEEMTRFLAMLEGGSKRIMTVCGAEGMGKSLLMERMVHECGRRQRRTSKTVCRDTRNNALFIMRSIRDDLTVECFNEFTNLANAVTAARATPTPQVTVNINAPIDVAHGLTAEGQARVGDISVVKISQDLMAPQPDVARRWAEGLAQLTDAFVSGLRTAIKNDPVVIFIDDCQKMTPETDTWLREELLFAVQEGSLEQAYFVLVGQNQPDLKSVSFLTQEELLGPLSKDHIAAYLAKRGIDEPLRSDLAKMLWVVTQGRIAEIERHVEAYLNESRQTRSAA